MPSSRRPDPGFPDHGHHLPVSCLSTLQGPVQGCQLRVAAHKARQASCHAGLEAATQRTRADQLEDIDQATAQYRQALALAEELGMRPLQAHCHRGLGTLYAATGQQEQARTALSTAIEMYRAMDMAFWLPQAEAALAQVAQP